MDEMKTEQFINWVKDYVNDPDFDSVDDVSLLKTCINEFFNTNCRFPESCVMDEDEDLASCPLCDERSVKEFEECPYNGIDCPESTMNSEELTALGISTNDAYFCKECDKYHF